MSEGKLCLLCCVVLELVWVVTVLLVLGREQEYILQYSVWCLMKSVTVLKFFTLTHYKELLTGYETVWIQHRRLCVTNISKQDSARRRCYFFIVVLLPVTSTDPPWNDKQVQPKTVYHFIYLNRFKGWSSWKEKWCLCVFLCLWKDDGIHQSFKTDLCSNVLLLTSLQMCLYGLFVCFQCIFLYLQVINDRQYIFFGMVLKEVSSCKWHVRNHKYRPRNCQMVTN